MTNLEVVITVHYDNPSKDIHRGCKSTNNYTEICCIIVSFYFLCIFVNTVNKDLFIIIIIIINVD